MYVLAFTVADSGKNPDNEAILEAAGVPRTKLSGAEKVRMARIKRAEGAGAANPPRPSRGEGSAAAGESLVVPTSPRPEGLGNKRRKLVHQPSPEVISEEVPVASSGAALPEDRSSEGLIVDLDPSLPEEGALVRKKRNRESPSPSAAEMPRAEVPEVSADASGGQGGGTRVPGGGLGSAMIPFDVTGEKPADLKALMKKLFAFHAQGNGILLQVSDQIKVLERDSKRSAEECAEAKEKHLKVRAQLHQQYDNIKLMKGDFEAVLKEKIKGDKEIAALRERALNAEKKLAEVEIEAKEFSDRAQASAKQAEDAESGKRELEELLQAEKEEFNRSADTLRLQTDQLKHLKDNVQLLVEDWSSREADWVRGPVVPTSPSILLPALRQSVIEQYKASDQFQADIQDAVVNEFNDGFEYARELVREKGHNPDELGIVIPEN